MKKILIGGGTGLVGTELKKLLQKHDYEVRVLSRSKSGSGFYQWNPDKNEIDPQAIEWADVIVNLAGEGIASARWTQKQKEKIKRSRIDSTKLLYEGIKEAIDKPKLYISASAIGYYGALTSDTIFTEESPSHPDFLGTVGQTWEDEVKKIETMGITTTCIRIGVVISWKGGALPKMVLPFKFGLGSALGSGKQWMPWIGLSDLVRLFKYVIELPQPQKVYNAVAPEHINNKEFSKILAKHLNRPFFLPSIPKWLLKIVLGEMSVMLLEGSRVSSERILKEGFRFDATQLVEALQKNQ